MKNKLFFLMIICFLLCAQDIKAENKDEIEIFRNIKCLTCNGQSIEESHSDFSKKLRDKISLRLKQGYIKEEIYREIQKDYGDDIFFTSPDNKNLAIIIASFVFIFFIGFVIYIKR
jgi:cytochrome c-type biogenesis protein CcmH